MRALIFCALLAACAPMSEGTASFPDAPYSTTQAGAYTIALRTAPSQPPARGDIDMLLSVTDAMGMPADGLSLGVVPWMPAMGHGSSMECMVTPRGNGEYLVTNLMCPMPGTWELRVSGAGADTTVISLSVE